MVYYPASLLVMFLALAFPVFEGSPLYRAPLLFRAAAPRQCCGAVPSAYRLWLIFFYFFNALRVLFVVIPYFFAP